MKGRALLVAGAMLLAAAPGAAQAPASPPDSLPDSRLFVGADAWLLAGFAGATIAMFPLDRQLAARVRDDRISEDATLRAIAEGLDVLGGAGPFVIGSALYLTGRLADRPRVTHLAVHATEAAFVAAFSAGVLKVVLGRARPHETPDTNPASFVFGRGLRGDPWQSFPSGHSAVSFAVAAAVTSETSIWWPRSRRFVGPLLFGGAALVGIARMYENEHWASDVVVGAAIGTFAGLKTVRFNHTRAGNRVDRWLLGEDALRLEVSPGAGGTWRAGVGVSW